MIYLASRWAAILHGMFIVKIKGCLRYSCTTFINPIQVRSIAKVTKAVALGDLSKQIEVDACGEILDLKIIDRPNVIYCSSHDCRCARGLDAEN